MAIPGAGRIGFALETSVDVGVVLARGLVADLHAEPSLGRAAARVTAPRATADHATVP
jgi:hypothetical protein